MFFLEEIQKRVYYLYHKSVPILIIAHYLSLTENDVDEIIDYLNTIYY